MKQTIIMVAPNGARKTRRDHRNLPVSIEDTVNEASDCFDAGASVLHAHVRGSEEEHVLDVGRYRELLGEMAHRVPDMLVQITSEAVGRYSPAEQAAYIQAVKPTMTSMALREITVDYQRLDFARTFFEWCVEAEVHLQHIVFSAEELDRFVEFRNQGVIPSTQRCVLFVLGRYTANFQSDPDDLNPFLERDLSDLDWFTCAFGSNEQACVMKAIEQGGHARVGFENNLQLADGEIARSSAALVASLSGAILAGDRSVAEPRHTAQLLGIRSA